MWLGGDRGGVRMKALFHNFPSKQSLSYPMRTRSKLAFPLCIFRFGILSFCVAVYLFRLLFCLRKGWCKVSHILLLVWVENERPLHCILPRLIMSVGLSPNNTLWSWEWYLIVLAIWTFQMIQLIDLNLWKLKLKSIPNFIHSQKYVNIASIWALFLTYNICNLTNFTLEKPRVTK